MTGVPSHVESEVEVEVGAEANSDVCQSDRTWLTRRSSQSGIGIKTSDPTWSWGSVDRNTGPTGDKFTPGTTDPLIDVNAAAPWAP